MGKPAESFTNRDGEASGDEVVEAETDPLKKKKRKKRKRPTAGVETGSVGLIYHGGFKLWRSSLGAGPKKNPKRQEIEEGGLRPLAVR